MIDEVATRRLKDAYEDLDRERLAQTLSRMVQFRTIADMEQDKIDMKPFIGLREYLKEAFPLVHKTCELEIINGASLLYKWKGTGEKEPYLLMAHLDVVPVTPGTEKDWEHDAFAGEIVDGHVWGRGSLDIKNMVCAELSAAEYLIGKGFVPSRDIYFAYGHDEEVGGFNGALNIAAHLKNRGVRLAFVIDEGGSPKKGDDLGAPDTLLAQVALFEKGYADVHVIAKSKGGHSSAPGKKNALTAVARAIIAIEENPFPAALPVPFEKYYRAIGPHMSDPEVRKLVENMDNDKEAFIKYLEKTSMGNAMVRTTAAATQAWGSPAGNILPQTAVMNVNFRLAPGETIESMMERVKKTVNNDEITYELYQARPASKVAGTDSEGFELISKTIKEFHPEIIVAPTGTLGGTDSCKYEDICDNIYKFAPFFDENVYWRGVHGTNEHITIEDLTFGTKYLIRFMENAQ